jgi:hypothetical protein
MRPAALVISSVLLGIGSIAHARTIVATTAPSESAPPSLTLHSEDHDTGGRSDTHAITIPAGTLLRLQLDQRLGSDFSRTEDPVRAHLARPIVEGGRTVIPAGSVVVGSVVDARRSGRVKGRARLAMRFHSLTPRGGDERYRINTSTWARQAKGTKKKDALTIGVPAAGGAIVGGIAGGKKGAGIGALVGGGGGTGVVLATRGKEVRLGRGAIVAVRLARPLVIRG